jgi:DNA modification methylase
MDLHAHDVHVPDDLAGHDAPLPASPTGTRQGRPRAASPSTTWRNRITGHGEADPKVLIPNPANWRTHPREQHRALAGAMTEVGWVAQVLVNRTTGHVVDGHLRVELAISRNEATVPVTYVELSEDEERLVLATLDPLAAMASADTAKLAELLADLTPSDDALRSVLAELADRNGIGRVGLTDPDEVPPVPDADDLYVAPGDLFALGEHRILCGDSTKPADVARLMAGQKAVLMATDPPYLVDYGGGNHPQSWHNKAAVKDKHWDDYVDPAAASGFFEAFLRAALPHLAPGVALYQWHAHRRAALVEAAWTACGLLVHQQLIWVKARSVLTHSHFMWQHEPCFYGWVAGTPPVRRPPAGETTVWPVDQIGESDGIHPTQKPVELFARPIGWHALRGEICYDPFAGSGTSLIAAERLGRRCYALEIEPRFVQVTIERWQRFSGKSAERIDG